MKCLEVMDNIFPYHIDKVHKFQNNINSRLIYAYNQMKNKKFNFDEYLFTLNNQGLSTTDGMPYYEKDIFLNNFKINPIKNEYRQFYKFGFLKYSQIKDIEYIKIPRVLKYSDRLSMSYGVECRVSTLDNQLFDYCFNLKNDEKYSNGMSRHKLKQIFKNTKFQNILLKIKSLVDPQKIWLKSYLKDYLMDNINSKNIHEINLFEPKVLKNYCENFFKGKVNSSYLLFTILTTLRFIENFKMKERKY